MNIDEQKRAIYAQIAELRKQQGITQQELEKLSGVRQPIIARIEKGTVSPQISTLIKILVPLGYTLAIAPIDK